MNIKKNSSKRIGSIILKIVNVYESKLSNDSCLANAYHILIPYLNNEKNKGYNNSKT